MSISVGWEVHVSQQTHSFAHVCLHHLALPWHISYEGHPDEMPPGFKHLFYSISSTLDTRSSGATQYKAMIFALISADVIRPVEGSISQLNMSYDTRSAVDDYVTDVHTGKS